MAITDIRQEKLGRLRAAIEPTFATEVSIGSFFDVPWVEGSAVIRRPLAMESPMHAQQLLDGYAQPIVMPKLGCELEFTTNFESFATKGTSGVAATRSWLIKLLETAYGGTPRQSTGTTISGTSSTTAVVNVASASSYRAGGAYGIVDASGRLETREIKSISSNAITPKVLHSFAPTTAGVDVYAPYSCYLDPRGTMPATLQFAVEEYQTQARWLLMGGGIKSIAFENLQTGGIPRIKWVFQFATWKRADGSATTMNLVGGNLGIASYTDVNTLVNKDSDLRFGTVGSTTLPSFLHFNAIEITPNLQIERLATPGGTETTRGWIRRHEAPAFTGSFTMPREDASFETTHAAVTKSRFNYQVGSIPSRGCFLMTFPTIYITDIEDVRSGGVLNQKVSWRAALDDESVSAGATDADDMIARASHKLHVF